MKLPILLLADYANITSDGKLNVMGVFTDINATSYPARHPTMFLVLKFAPELGELDQTKTLTVKLQDSDSQPVLSLPLPFVIKQNELGKRPDSHYIIQLNDTVFPKEGGYEFVVLLDDERMGEIAVNANLIPPETSG
jgi:hypothetical protein